MFYQRISSFDQIEAIGSVQYKNPFQKFYNHNNMKKVSIYQMIKQIGQGSYGSVYLAKKQNSEQKLAIKMISTSNLEQKQIQLVEMEIQVLQTINHPNIIKLIDVRRTKNNYYLVFEYCEKGDLEKYLKKYCQNPLGVQIVQKIIYNVSDAIKQLHSKKIVHRDIKLANILLTKDFDIKLSDFGFAKTAKNELLMETYCGTPMNMAPQILLRSQYSLKCDIWSMGVVSYQLVYGKLPFFPKNGKGLIDLIETIQATEEIIFPTFPIMPQSFKKLIIGSLQKNPSKRISIEQFFNNQWVQQGMKVNVQFTQGASTTSELLRQFSGTIQIQLPQQQVFQKEESEVQNTSLDQIDKSEKYIAQRIFNSVLFEIKKIVQYLDQLKKSCHELKTKLHIFQELLNFLIYSYIKNVSETPVNVSYGQQNFSFLIDDIKEFQNTITIPSQEQCPSPFRKLVQLLQIIAEQQKNNSKQQTVEDYKIILKLFPLFQRFAMNITITLSNSSKIVKLKNIKKSFISQDFGGQCLNGVVLFTSYHDKNLELIGSAEKLKKLCEQRITDIEAEIAKKQ